MWSSKLLKTHYFLYFYPLAKPKRNYFKMLHIKIILFSTFLKTVVMVVNVFWDPIYEFLLISLVLQKCYNEG